MQLQIDFTHQSAKINQTPKTIFKSTNSQIEINEQKLKFSTSSKNCKKELIKFQYIRTPDEEVHALKPNLVIIIKLSGLAEVLLWQIKNINRDDTIADLLMSSRKNHHRNLVNHKKA